MDSTCYAAYMNDALNSVACWGKEWTLDHIVWQVDYKMDQKGRRLSWSWRTNQILLS